MIPNQEILKLLKAAIECSVFLSPIDPGLTYDELIEVGKRAGYLEGETADAARQAGQWNHQRKMLPDATTRVSWSFVFPEDPDYRNFDAFDFIVTELNDRVRHDGAGAAQIDRDVVVDRASAKGILRIDIEAAITYQLLSEQLVEKDRILRFAQGGGVREVPSTVRDKLARGGAGVLRRPDRAKAYPIVKDIIDRRTDGRPLPAEPLDAFANRLQALGYGAFRLWWTQTVAELRRADTGSAPLSVSLLAASLVEGALTFVVRHGRKFGAFRSSDFDRDPRTWKIDDLVASAASGGESAILSLQTKNRAETLIRTRQRIHAGRMLSEFPAGVPDIRPEEARDAIATAEQAVRSVLDWLQKYPPE